MRIIAVKTLKGFYKKHHQAEASLKAWYKEADNALWKSPQELKLQYRNASILSEKRVVFNVHGNDFRLIVDIEYRLKILFIVWIGTHKQYDLINARTISYDKGNKK